MFWIHPYTYLFLPYEKSLETFLMILVYCGQKTVFIGSQILKKLLVLSVYEVQSFHFRKFQISQKPNTKDCIRGSRYIQPTIIKSSLVLEAGLCLEVTHLFLSFPGNKKLIFKWSNENKDFPVSSEKTEKKKRKKKKEVRGNEMQIWGQSMWFFDWVFTKRLKNDSILTEMTCQTQQTSQPTNQPTFFQIFTAYPGGKRIH